MKLFVTREKERRTILSAWITGVDQGFKMARLMQKGASQKDQQRWVKSHFKKIRRDFEDTI